MKMRQHRASMAYCIRCECLLCAFYLSWTKGGGCPQACRTAGAARTMPPVLPPWLRACGRCCGRTVSPVCESENPRLPSAQAGGYLRSELKGSASATARMTKIMRAGQNLRICLLIFQFFKMRSQLETQVYWQQYLQYQSCQANWPFAVFLRL